MSTFLKTNWKRPGAGAMLGLLGLVAVVVVVVVCWPRAKQTLYVLPEPVPVDSVRSYPNLEEQSAEARWDSLKKLQP